MKEVARSLTSEEKQLIAFVNRISNITPGPCMYPGKPICKAKSCKAHSIQNKGVLKSLVSNGHVIMVDQRAARAKKPRPAFRSVGRNLATTFAGLCGQHDGILFAPIDLQAIDLEDTEHMFLLAYRSILRETHASGTVTRSMEHVMAKQKRLGIDILDRDMVSHLKGNAKWIAKEKAVFDEIYLSRNYDLVEHEVAWMPCSPPSLAVSSFFSIGRSSYSGEQLTISVNVFPLDGRHAIVLSFRRPARRVAQELTMAIKRTVDNYRFRAVSCLVLKNSENFVLKPELYNSFSKEQKQVISDYFDQSTLVPPYGANEIRPVPWLIEDNELEKLNLFQAVN